MAADLLCMYVSPRVLCKPAVETVVDAPIGSSARVRGARYAGADVRSRRGVATIVHAI